MFDRTFSIIGARWRPILVSILLSAVLLAVLLFTMVVPAMNALLPKSGAASADVAATSLSQVTATDPTTGLPIEAADPTPGDRPAADGPDSGDVLFVLLAMGLYALLLVTAVNTGVYAAAGNDAMDAIREGTRTSPHVIVQALRIAWLQFALYGGATAMFLAGIFGASALLSVVGGLGMIVGIVLLLRISGVLWLSLGSIAHGNVSWDPSAAREAAAGREWQASGVAFVGGVVGNFASAIPLAGLVLGPLFMSAYVAAMWQEYECGPGSDEDAVVPAPGAGDTGVLAVPAPAAGAASSVGATSTTTPADRPAATPAATALVAGPTWNGVASPGEPLGQWLQLAAPARVAVQVQWTTGDAPALQFADQAGTWTVAAEQPTASGETIWLEAPAGWTWLALVPRDAQQLWVTTWLPAGVAAAAPPASGAA